MIILLTVFVSDKVYISQEYFLSCGQHTALYCWGVSQLTTTQCGPGTVVL